MFIKKQKILSLFLSLVMILTALPLTGVTAFAQTSGESEKVWFGSVPSSAVFDKLWVGDIVVFDSQFYISEYDEAAHDWVGSPEPGNVMTIVSGGDCVKISEIHFGEDLFAYGLEFTKPGKAQVKINEKDQETGETREKTFSFTVTERPADKSVTATYSHSLGDVSVKIGERLCDNAWKDCYKEDYGRNWPDIKFNNANYGKSNSYDGTSGYVDINEQGLFFTFYGGFGGGVDSLVEDDRVAFPQREYRALMSELAEYAYAYKPGTDYLNLSYKEWKNLGCLGSVTVEEPVIKTNAPISVKVGSTLDLTTELTDTALKNLKTSEYEKYEEYEKNFVIDDYNTSRWYYDGDNNPVAYKPSVTVTDGADCVKQSAQDYTNTLTSSETLSFIKTGTVKLKISYKQFATDSNLLCSYKYDEEKQETIEYKDDKRYNPEKIITIQVTEDGNPVFVPSGEVSGDGKLSTVDAKWILQNIAKSRDFSDEQFKAADLNGDGKLSVVDVKWVLQIVAGMRNAETLEPIK